MIGGIVIGVILLVLAIRAFKQPFFGLLGLLIINVVNPGELYDIFNVLHVERIFVLIVLFSTLMSVKLRFPAISKSILAFWVVMLMGVPFAFFKGGALSKSLDFGPIVLYHVLTVSLVGTRERLLTYLRTFVALMVWTAGSSLWAFQHGEVNAEALRNGFERAQGLTASSGDPNTLGITLVSSIPLLALLLFFGSKLDKAMSFLAIALSLVSVILTGSRTSFVLLVFLVISFSFTRKKGILLLVAMAIVTLASWSYIPDAYKERYLSVGDSLQQKQVDWSYKNRLIAWAAGRQMFLDYPLFGVGKGQFLNANGAKYWPGPYKLWLNPHNLYVQLMAELGIAGILSWTVFILIMFRDIRHLKRTLKDRDEPGWIRYLPTAVQFALFTLFVAGYSSHCLYRPTWYMLAGLIGAMTLILQSENAPPQPTGDAQEDAAGVAVQTVTA